MSCTGCSKTFAPTFMDIICCSFCVKQFHSECSGIDRAAFNSLKKFNNLCYFCDSCKVWIKNNQVSTVFKKIDSIVDRAATVIDIHKIESNVAANTKLITELFNRVANVPVSNPLLTYANVTELSSSSNSSSLPLRGVIGTGAPVDSIKPAVLEAKSYLYVSRVDPSVSQDSIVDYIRSKLELSSTDDVDCKLLLAKDRVVDNSLTYISFKIGLHNDHFDKLNNSIMWPAGVIIRPFVNHPRKPKNGTGVIFHQSQD